jgi:hypothetical protein
VLQEERPVKNDMSEYAVAALRALEQGQQVAVTDQPGWFWLGNPCGPTEVRELERHGLVTTQWLPHSTGWEAPGTKRLAVKLKN